MRIGREMHSVLSITTSIIIQFFFDNTSLECPLKYHIQNHHSGSPILIIDGDIAFYTSFEIISGYKDHILLSITTSIIV
jgi:hypothetical protein